MTLFHGSNVNIQKIDLSKCRPNKDFGKGFYLTTIKEQAQRMAIRVSKMYGGNPILNIYSFDERVLSFNEIKVRVFENPSEEWAKFVIANRNYQNNKNFKDNNLNNFYDIVSGPIANDDLALLFRQFSDGLISVETLVKGMEFKKLTDQYSFHTEKALQFLLKTGVESV